MRDWSTTIVVWIIIVSILAFLVILYDVYFPGYLSLGVGEIVGKNFCPGQTSMGIASGMTTKGSVGTGIVVVGASDQYILFVSVDGVIIKANSDERLFLNSNVGDCVRTYKRVGRILGINTGIFAKQMEE